MNLSILYKKLTNRKYTIGYKFILSLFIGLIGLNTFCSAGSYVFESDYSFNVSNWSQSFIQFIPIPVNLNPSGTTSNLEPKVSFDCTVSNSTGIYSNVSSFRLSSITLYKAYSLSQSAIESLSIDDFLSGNPYSFSGFVDVRNDSLLAGIGFKALMSNSVSQFYGSYHIICTFSGDIVVGQSQYTSEKCQSEYNLVPSSDLSICNNNLQIYQSSLNDCQLDLNNCQNNTSGFNDLLNNCSNNLNACNNSLTSCLQQNCPETVTGTNRSSLFINNIQYPGAPTIKFTIPEEIERDQYTDEEETNIDVIGYGYDQDKMQQMVNTQYYKPTAEEMSGLMEKVADFLPLVAVALLITRIRRVIKKVF